MSTLTPLQVRWIRSEIGDSPDDAALNEIYSDVGTVRDVAIRTLRRRVDDMLSSPLSVTLSGVASINNTGNVAALEKRIAGLSRLDADPSDEPGETIPADLEGGTFERYHMTRSRGR